SAGFEEAAPGQARFHEDVGPERRGCGKKFELRERTRIEEIAKISEEDLRPGTEFYQECGSRRGFEIQLGRCFRHLCMLDGRGRFGIAGRTLKLGGNVQRGKGAKHVSLRRQKRDPSAEFRTGCFAGLARFPSTALMERSHCAKNACSVSQTVNGKQNGST